jgi:two-component system cell cycle sensor histidine kinase/response regulator CckA
MKPRAAPPAASDFFEMSLDHLCIVGFDGYFMRVNPSWTRTLGWTAEELLAMPSIDLVHPDDRAKTIAGRRQLHQGAPLEQLRNRYLCKDGSYRWFEWRSIASLDDSVVYAAARDITDQIVAEESLRDAKEQQEKLRLQLLFADRMASVGTLAAGSAHEINGPLVSVTANIAMILEELRTMGETVSGDQIAELTRMANEVRTGAEKIRRIVRGLKTFSRAAEDRPTIIEVKQAIELAISLTANEIGQHARLITDYGPTPTIHADDARFSQVLINLLVNAAQAIPEGHSTSHEIRIVTSTDADGRAVIEVRDTGPGIHPSILNRIFDPFFTTKPIGVGTGLGLSICHNIVTAMGGQLSVASELGHGTTFRIVLPAAKAERAQTAPLSVIAPDASMRGTVLVVDDDPMVGGVLRRVLKQHDVTVTTRAKEALELLEEGRRFDVILSDLMMPEMSGMELHDRMIELYPEAAERVVFISGGAFTAGANTFLERVANIRIEKPFDAQTVRAIVQRFIKQASP